MTLTMFKTVFIYSLILVALGNVSVCYADYTCACNYDVETKIMNQDSSEGTLVGYLYEFDCKELLTVPTNNGWLAIAFEHKVAYIHNQASNIQVQLCAGDPPVEDALLSTTTSKFKSTRGATPLGLSTTGIIHTSTSSQHSHITSAPTSFTSSTKPTASTNVPSSTEPTASTNVLSSIEPTDLTNVPSGTEPTASTYVPSGTEPTASTNIRSSIEPTASNNIRSSTEPTDSTNVPSSTEPTVSTNTPSRIEPTDLTNVPSSTEPTASTNTSSSTEPTESTNVPSSTEPTASTNIRSSIEPIASTNVPSSTERTDSTNVPPSTEPTASTNVHLSTEPTASTKVPSSTEPTASTYVPSSTKPTALTTAPSSTNPTTTTTSSSSTKTISTTTSAASTKTTIVTVVSGRVDLCPYHVLARTNYSKSAGYLYMRQYGDYCYELRPLLADWTTARQDCIQRSGDLVEVTNPSVQETMIDLLRTLDYQHDVWIGLYDTGKSGTWTWVNGKHLSGSDYTNWKTGQADLVYGNRQECVMMGGMSGKWSEAVCSSFLLDIQRHPWICQYKRS